MSRRTISTDAATAIIVAVSQETNLPFCEIVGDGRSRNLTAARRLAYKRMRDAQASYAEIGRLMQRHHTTVMHALGIV